MQTLLSLLTRAGPRRHGTSAAAGTPSADARRVFGAFRLSVALDRNTGQIRVKALISSAFNKVCDLESLVAIGSIAGAGCGQISPTASRTASPRFDNSGRPAGAT